jgi:ATP-binding cassette subfamily F protein uup
MDKMIDHLFIFEGQSEIRDFPGTYTQYRDWKIAQKGKEKQSQQQPKAVAVSSEQPKIQEQKSDSKKTSFKILHEIEQLEKDMAALEEKKIELENKLSSGITDHIELQKLGEELVATIKLVDEKSFRWLELQG